MGRGVTRVVFSPTGGTARVARLVADGIEAALASAPDAAPDAAAPDAAAAPGGAAPRVVDLCDRATDLSQVALRPDDVCVVAVPVYGGRVPAVAAERLSAVRGNGAAAVAVVVYGNRAYDDALLELSDLLGAAGLECVAAVAAVAEHSIVRECAAGRPDAADERALASLSARVAQRLRSGRAPLSAPLPGHRPPAARHGGPATPQADPCVCAGCGTCARLCPVGAIDAADPLRTDAAACVSCMRCVAACPSHARAVDPATLAAVSAKLRPVATERREPELYL